MATPWYLNEILHAWEYILYKTDGSLLKTKYDYGVCMQEILCCPIIGIKLVITVLEGKASSNQREISYSWVYTMEKNEIEVK